MPHSTMITEDCSGGSNNAVRRKGNNQINTGQKTVFLITDEIICTFIRFTMSKKTLIDLMK